MKNGESKLEAALAYAKAGLHVFPLHSVVNGACSCGNDTCQSQGKHPRTARGFKDASRGEKEIRAYWSKWPDANIGCATGENSGVVVIDLDVKHGKNASQMKQAMTEGGKSVPDTVCSRTGQYKSGDHMERGEHHFYKHPLNMMVMSRANILKSRGIEGVDIRGDGGYVVLPPSGHISGVTYEWIAAPGDVDLAPLPEWVLGQQEEIAEGDVQVNVDWESIFNSDVLEGMRNQTATKVAGKIAQLMPMEAWPVGFELLNNWNQANVNPPLKVQELRRIWSSIGKAERQSRKARKEAADAPIVRVRIEKCPAPEKTVSFDEWSNVVKANFPDLIFPAEVGLSVCAQTLIKDISNPFALVFIDVPSSGKTIVVNFFDDLPEITYSTDKFSAASFVSNAANVSKAELAQVDLLPRIQYRMFLIRDLAPLFAKRDEDLNESLGILTRVLDGEGLNTDSGVHGHRGYRGDYFFTLLAASTPIQPHVWKVMGNLGSRLLFLGVNSRNKDEGELANQLVDVAYKEKEKACREATRDLLYSLWGQYPAGVEWDKKADPQAVRAIITRCAMLLARLRGVVNVWQDDFMSTDYKFGTPLVEKPDRLNQQFYNLARGHALVSGRTQLSMDDVRPIVELCIDGAPTARARVFRLLIDRGGSLRTSEVEKALNCSKPTALKEMKTMQILGICTYSELTMGQEYEITLIDDLAWFLGAEFQEMRVRPKTASDDGWDAIKEF